MKFAVFAVVLLCATAAFAQIGRKGHSFPKGGFKPTHRFRREADPQGSLVLEGSKPLDGPDRRPSVNLDYRHRIMDNGRSAVDVYGGANKLPGQPIRPEFGIRGERNFGRDGFINGQFGASHGPRGRLEPTFGANAGFRFRRDVEDKIEIGQDDTEIKSMQEQFEDA